MVHYGDHLKNGNHLTKMVHYGDHLKNGNHLTKMVEELQAQVKSLEEKR